VIPFAPKIVGNTKIRFSGGENVRSRFAKSGLALDELGKKMGQPDGSA
jgi:hypothetical protein